MKDIKHNLPFGQFLYRDIDGYYHVRLGQKVYLVKISLNYTPNFDKAFFGGVQALDFEWSSILVKDKIDSLPRLITNEELEKKWLKRELKKIINYQRVKERSARSSQIQRYSANQRISYRNK